MNSFQEVLQSYLDQTQCNPNRLARISGVPRSTIVNWLQGWVERPRYWRDLVKVATALHLNIEEVNALLRAAGHPSVFTLLAQFDDAQARESLSPWDATVKRPDTRAPFLPVARLPYFVGREAELMLLQEALLNYREVRLCSLEGMGGVGKTALAVHLAYGLSSYFPDGVLWAQVDKSDTMAILGAFAHVYGVDVSAYTDVKSRSQVVQGLLAGKRALMVLDDVQKNEQARPLLPPGGACAALITTRRHDLTITRAAHRLTLGPFSKDKGEALDLFARVLGAETVARDGALLSEIGDLLGQLPLAIDIAASRLAYEPDWTAAELLARLRDQRRRLSELVYDDQAVRWSFDLSYAALSVQDQALFRALGVFEGVNFDVEAAAYVAGSELAEARDGLRRLCGLSLLQSVPPRRYRLHPLLRDYARELSSPHRLKDERGLYGLPLDGVGEGDGDILRERMLTYFVDYAESHVQDDAALDVEESNLLAALEWAHRSGKRLELIRGTHALHRHIEIQGRYALAQKHLERVEQVARAAVYGEEGDSSRARDAVAGDSVAGDNVAHDLALTLSRLGWLALRQGDCGRARNCFQEGLNLARRLEDDEILAAILKGLGSI